MRRLRRVAMGAAAVVAVVVFWAWMWGVRPAIPRPVESRVKVCVSGRLSPTGEMVELWLRSGDPEYELFCQWLERQKARDYMFDPNTYVRHVDVVGERTMVNFMPDMVVLSTRNSAAEYWSQYTKKATSEDGAVRDAVEKWTQSQARKR